MRGNPLIVKHDLIGAREQLEEVVALDKVGRLQRVVEGQIAFGITTSMSDITETTHIIV